MKLQKFFYLFLAIIMAGVMLSCGDDDDDSGSSEGGGSGSGPGAVVSADKLIGKWEFVDGEEIVGYSGQGFSMDDTKITFDRNTVTQYAQQAGVGIWDLTLVFTETTVNGQPYKMNGDVLMDQTFEGGSVNVRVKSVTDDVLYLYEVIDMTSNGIKMDIKATMHYRKTN